MADEALNLNLQAEIAGGDSTSATGGTGIPYPQKPGADYRGEWPEDVVDREAMRQADANYSRTGILFSAPDNPDIKNFYGGSITPPWAATEQTVTAPPPPPNPQVEQDFGPRIIASGIEIPAVNAQVEDWSQSWQGAPSAPAPARSAPRFDTYADYQNAKTDIRNDLANVYTQSGRAGEVGGAEFERDLQGNLVSAELAERETALTRLRSGFDGMGGAFGIGYSGMALAEGGGRAYAALNDGDYHTQAQQGAAMSAMLPGAGAIVGMTLGAAVGGVPGAIIGQFAGQGIGGAAQEVIGANAGIADAQERAAQSLAVGNGDSASAVKEFVEALRGAATPAAKELAETLAQLGRGGNVTPGAASYFAGLQYQLGPAFGETVTGADRFLGSSPFLAPLHAAVDAGSANPNDLLGAAAVAADTGDYGGMRDLLGEAQAGATRNAENPAYRRDADFVKRFQARTSIWDGFYNMFHPSYEDDYTNAKDRLKTETPYLPGSDPTGGIDPDQFQSWYQAHEKSDAGVALSTAQTGLNATQLQAQMLSGGGAATLSAALPGLQQSVSGGQSALDTDITNLQAGEKQFPGMKPQFDALIAQDQLKRAQMGLQVVDVQQEQFKTSIGESTAAYTLSVTDATYGGQSAAQISGVVSGQEAALRGFASDPLANPQLRSQLQTEAREMEYRQAQSVYGQEEGALNVRGAQREQNLAYAQNYGTPDQVYSARQGTAQQELDSARQLTGEIERGNLTYDQRLEKQRQIVELNTQAMQVEAQARQERASANYDLAETGAATAHVGLDRALTVGGTAGVNWQAVEGADQGTLTAARAKLAAAQTPQQIQAAQLLIAQAQLGIQQDVTASHTWRFTEGQNVAEDNAVSGFRRDMIAPWMDGDPNSNPLTAGQNVLGVYQERLSELQRAQAKTDPNDPAFQANNAQINSYKDRIADVEHDRLTGWLSILPEEVAGGPGRGFGSAVLPFAALSASGMASPMAGGFGHSPATLLPTSSGGVAPGGAAGGFSQTTGIENLLSSILRVLQQGGRGGVSPPTSAPVANGGAVNQVLSNSYDPYRRGQ